MEMWFLNFLSILCIIGYHYKTAKTIWAQFSNERPYAHLGLNWRAQCQENAFSKFFLIESTLFRQPVMKSFIVFKIGFKYCITCISTTFTYFNCRLDCREKLGIRNLEMHTSPYDRPKIITWSNIGSLTKWDFID